MITSKPRSPVAGEKHVLAVLHDRDREIDRMPNVANAGCAAGRQIGAQHYAGIELDIPIGI